MSSSTINLAWTDNSLNEVGFKVERASSSTGPWTQIGLTTQTGYGDSGLPASTTFWYRVRAYNTAGDSGYTNTSSSTTMVSTGAHIWSTHFGGPNVGGDTATPTAIAVDGTGAAIVAGYFKGNVDFGGIAMTSAGLGDIYLVKYSATGGILWARHFGSTADDRPKGVAVDTGNNVYLTGYFRDTVDFGGGPIVGSSNGFLVKYTSAGTHVWSKRLATGGLDEGTAVGVDGGGNVFVTASIYQTSDFGGGPFTTLGGADTVLVKYSSTGAHLWSRRLGGTSDDLANALVVDTTTGEVWVTGSFGGTANFGGGSVTSAGVNDIFVVRYSSAGVHNFSRTWGGTGDDKGYGITVDRTGNMIVTGMFTNTVDFGAGPVANSAGGDIFLVKYSAAGICQWSKGFGSTVSFSNALGFGTAADSVGNIFLTGAIVSSVDFGRGVTTGDGWYNAFIAKFDPAGGNTWSKRYTNGTGHSNGRVVGADALGNVVAAGDFEVAINLGGATLNSPGALDTYLVKLGP
jgi:hypothetical protein